MIRSFADQGLEDLFNGRATKQARRIPQDLWTAIRRKLDTLNADLPLENLAQVPGNRLHQLQGDRQGTYAVRVNDQFRLTFRMAEGEPYDVRCEDYH